MKTHFPRTAAIALLTLAPFFPNSAEVGIAAPEMQSSPMVSAVQQAQKISVPLTESGGAFSVSVEINETVTVDMLLDSGAADVAVSEEVFRRLEATGAVKNGEKHYMIANGTTIRRDLFTIDSLKIGDVILRNVEANVGPGPLLLGQAFLKRLGSWSIDNAAHILILEAKGSDYAPSSPPLPVAKPHPPVATPPPSTDIKLRSLQPDVPRPGFHVAPDDLKDCGLSDLFRSNPACEWGFYGGRLKYHSPGSWSLAPPSNQNSIDSLLRPPEKSSE
jgi:clan AA aspartic protease (TIGR02281 family)